MPVPYDIPCPIFPHADAQVSQAPDVHSDGSVVANGTDFAIGAYGIWIADATLPTSYCDELSYDRDRLSRPG